MLTAGVNPTSAVRSTCAVKPAQSMSPFEVNGSKMADMPVIFRRGRSIRIGSMAALMGAPLGTAAGTGDRVLWYVVPGRKSDAFVGHVSDLSGSGGEPRNFPDKSETCPTGRAIVGYVSDLPG